MASYKGGDGMKVNIEDFKHALDIIGDTGGAEAAIVAQLALDLAVTARFHRTSPMKPEQVQRLLRERITRHRAAQCTISNTIH
jgi:hypothetical protein